MNDAVYIIDALRTPIAHRYGALRNVLPEHLGATVLQAILQRHQLTGKEIAGLFAGNAVGTGGNLARLTSLYAGLPENIPALTIDMQCASAAAAIGMAYYQAKVEGGVFLAGGMESSSLQPLRVYAPHDPRRPLVQAQNITGGYMTAQFSPDTLAEDAMLQGAERVAEAEDISRAEMDAWAMESHRRALRAQKLGYGHNFIVPVAGVQADTEPRHLSARLLARLPLLLGKGTHIHAANACLIDDGAAFVLLADKNSLQRYALKPKAKILGVASFGGAPAESPRGAMHTAEFLLQKFHLRHEDLQAIEYNEAFAVIDVLFARAHADCLEKYNRLGGALAYGHPYGASGAIIACHLLQSLKIAGGGKGLLAIAGAGGMGTAILVEAV